MKHSNDIETSALDPTAQDAVKEAEDIVPEDENVNEEAGMSEDATPNNEFYFTNDDFI